MNDRSFLSWPFFEPRHRELAEALQNWCEDMPESSGDLDVDCRSLVDWLARTVAEEGKINRTDLLLFRVTDDPAEAARLVIEARAERPLDPAARILG